ncbi:GNAT family N-acetyltransferase [Alkaliphilus crotonatoxidans]
MEEILIDRPKLQDRELIIDFFQRVLQDTFEANGITDLIETFEQEIKNKTRFLDQDFESGGKERYFLIAKEGEKLIGSIEYGKPNELIISGSNGVLENTVEIGTVFVQPTYQRRGIGSLLLDSIFVELKEAGITEFCFDSGYKIAQRVWLNKFGRPQYHLKDYWGKGSDHMIWKMKLEDVLKKEQS